MELHQIIEQIVAKEWPMFQTVNGGDHVSCQENEETFRAMRTAQFSAWSAGAAASYLRDLEQAEAAGRNLLREKYIRMMASTDPEGYEAFKGELPELSAAQEALIDKLWAHLLAQTERMRQQFPALAMGGRPLRASEETDGWASIETYQTGELATYSQQTLEALLEHLLALEKDGVELARLIQENSVKGMGYRTMEEAEKAIAFQYIQQLGGGECTTCGAWLPDAR